MNKFRTTAVRAASMALLICLSAVLMCGCLFSGTSSGSSKKFTDVTESGYAKNSDLYRAVLWITKKNIAKGYKQDDRSSIFGLTRGCYREYAVTYLYRVKDPADQ